jgi:hypothetical protein
VAAKERGAKQQRDADSEGNAAFNKACKFDTARQRGRSRAAPERSREEKWQRRTDNQPTTWQC